MTDLLLSSIETPPIVTSLTSISSQRSFNRRLNARSRAYNLPRGNQSATAHTINTIKTPIAI
jgi:hypothetical protein